MLHQLSWLGPAVGVQGWLWPQAEVIALKRGSCGFTASVKPAPQCTSLHHPSSSPLLGSRLGSTSGLAPSSTGAKGQKLVLPGAGEEPSSREGKALTVWMLGLFRPRRSFPWTARRITPLTQGGGRHQSWCRHPWKCKIIFVGAAEALLGCAGFLHDGAASCEQV